MKTILFKFIFISIIAVNIPSTASVHSVNTDDLKINNYLSSTDSCLYLSQDDAEKIMGKPVVFAETTNAEDGEVLRKRCVFTAVSTDDKKEKKEILYFGVDEYKDITSAQKVFSETVSENEKDAELKALQIGDEAFLQSTPEVFHFIMVRKGNKILSMKVNKISRSTSLDEMLRIAKEITSSI